MGTVRVKRPRVRLSSWIATARSYQLATPASAQWWIPARSVRRTARQSASARLLGPGGGPARASSPPAPRRLPEEAQHGQHEILPACRVHPGGPDDEGRISGQLLDRFLAGLLAGAIDVDRAAGRLRGVGCYPFSIEDEVGGEMDDPGAVVPGRRGEVRRAVPVHRTGALPDRSEEHTSELQSL